MVELLTPDYNKPKQIHTFDTNNQICSLASTEKFLIIGSVDEICGYEWKTTTSVKLGKPSWTLRIPTQSSIEQSDVNCLWLSDDEEKLYAGCGDGKVYVFNLEDGRLISTYEGHRDLIHSVHGK